MDPLTTTLSGVRSSLQVAVGESDEAQALGDQNGSEYDERDSRDDLDDAVSAAAAMPACDREHEPQRDDHEERRECHQECRLEPEHEVGDQEHRAGDPDGQETDADHGQAAGGHEHLFLLLDPAAEIETMVCGRSYQERDRAGRAAQAGEIDVSADLAELPECLLERHDQEEREQHLDSGQGDAQLIQKLDELPIHAFLSIFARHGCMLATRNSVG